VRGLRVGTRLFPDRQGCDVAPVPGRGARGIDAERLDAAPITCDMTALMTASLTLR